MIGSHNSMTYLPLKKWYLWPFKFIAKCQSKTIKEQYEDYGIRLFDFRIAFDKNFKPEFRHGVMRYNGNVYSILEYLNSKKDTTVRIILEVNKVDPLSTFLFRMFCKKIENIYSNIKFFGGNRKSNWERLYNFKNPDIQLTQMISSMTWKKWDDWFPWLYARFMNKKNKEKYKDSEYLLLDFIEI